MRLHHLEVTAFGPFADTVEVDFDELSGAGLFLLTGPTGAGKSSVLDALCFALYGDVPGDRGTAKRLRSDHAPPGVAPRVTLECTLSGRRFRITRSPAWERPKKRGQGTTVQQASVTIAERSEGAWQPLSSRLDETGHLVTRLLGMNLAQFTQVALLPQGRFQSFLRARSDERHRLLQQLFRTGRFEAVEAWLRDRRTHLAAQARDHQLSVAELASRISEAAGDPLPEAWQPGEPGAGAQGSALLPWAEGLTARAEGRQRAARLRLRAAATAALAADDALTSARRLADLQERRGRAERERARLAARADEIAGLRDRAARARRAAGLVPLREALSEARQEVRAAQHATTTRRSRLVSLLRESGAADRDLEGLGVDDLTRREQEALRGAAAAAALLPEERRLHDLRLLSAQGSSTVQALEEEAAELSLALSRLPGESAELAADRARAASAEAALPAATEALRVAREHLAAAQEAHRLDAALRAAELLRQQAVDVAQRSREQWLALQEQRITGMAAELAGRLAVGGCCPVCGSAEHPAPAAPHPDAPDEAAQRVARRRVDDAEAERHVREEASRDLQTRLALARAGSAGLTPDQARACVDRALTDVESLQSTAARLPTLTDALARAEQAQSRTARRQVETARALAAETTRLEGARRQADALERRISDLLADGPDRSLAARDERLGRLASACAELREALGTEAARRATVATSEERLRREGVRAGFADVADALAAVLTETELSTVETQVADHEAAVGACEQVLADEDLRVAAEAPTPDLVALSGRQEESAARHRSAEAAAATEAAAARRLRGLLDQLRAALREAAPLQEELALVTRLSAFVDGRSPDNRLQMRLSAYVLAARLSQVVAAANERLARMSDRRYTLEHIGRRGAGETRGGLSLTVRDEWTGETRDPATLSGGETFVVSLALALGLADVVTRESGGADVDTLFVDEGFGTLDADTLDDVLDTLDALRDGGRVVGVVSHVPQMRDRIPLRLDVAKGRGGSTLAVVRG